MTKLDLTGNDITALRGALEIAGNIYRQNATECRAAPAMERLAQQFDRQADDAAKLIERLDDAEADLWSFA
jgi:hypothetical protein